MKNYYKSGSIVLIKFPFSDLSAGKIRPALVICSGKDQDILLAPISSVIKKSREDIDLRESDFSGPLLPIRSCVRYKKLFTLNRKLVIKNYSEITDVSQENIKSKIIEFIRGK